MKTHIVMFSGGAGSWLTARRVVERHGADNTLLLFFQDNGGCAEGFGRGKVVGPVKRPAKPTLPPMGKDELQTQMVPPKSREGYPLRRGDGVIPSAGVQPACLGL